MSEENATRIMQTHTSLQALALPEGARVQLAGRVVNFRRLGAIAFGKLEDRSGRIQFCFNKRETPEQFKEWEKLPKMGSIVAISGRMWMSSTGEFTCLVDKDFRLLRDSNIPFPNKKDGLVDEQAKLRKRYLDICLDPEVKNVFQTRTKVISEIRSFLNESEFMEIETPILTPQASGAQARPFSTHHNAYDADLYLRIAPETYLKRALASSFDRVYEIGKNFRNEGIDSSHLQEFTSLEWYASYWDYRDNLAFFSTMLRRLLEKTGHSDYIVHYQGIQLDFSAPAVSSFREVFLNWTGVDPWTIESAKEIDIQFKTKVRPNLIQPIFLCDYPAHMSPLAQRSEDGQTVEQWQLIANGWELVKCYTELTDPTLQRKLLEEQMSERAGGDVEAMMLEEDFLECMEYGIPPCSGTGLGIDRFVALITNQTTLRDVVMFPTMF